MITKTTLGLILAAAMVSSAAMISSALIYNGIQHRHRDNGVQAAQNSVTPSATTTGNSTQATAGTSASSSPVPTPTPSGDQTGGNDTQQNQTQAPPMNSGNSDPGAGDASQPPAPAGAADGPGDPEQAPPPVAVVHRVHTYVAVHPVAVAAPAIAEAEAPVMPSVTPVHAASFVLPAGTALTLCLSEPLSSDGSQRGQNFSAVLDHDVAVGGQTIIPAGSPVLGKVVAARPVGLVAGEANLKLQVVAVNINNQNFAVTTLVRSFGPAIRVKSKIGKFVVGLARRADGEEHEVQLDEGTDYTFTLQQPLIVQ